jgi:hypothetical protein
LAIDFMVMPMSRYISGDFVTPAMQVAWEQGFTYSIFGPDGRRDLPPGLPFGGADAAKERARIVELVLEDLRALPREIASHLWDEGSLAEPRFHRVDPESYQALLEHFSNRPARSLFGFKIGRAPRPAHCVSPLLLPCAFDDPVEMVSPFERLVGSARHALRELSENELPSDAADAAETLRAALEDATELGLPLIVDW